MFLCSSYVIILCFLLEMLLHISSLCSCVLPVLTFSSFLFISFLISSLCYFASLSLQFLFISLWRPHLGLEVPADDDALVAKVMMPHHLSNAPLHLLWVVEAGLGGHTKGSLGATVVPHLHSWALSQGVVIIKWVPMAVICRGKLEGKYNQTNCFSLVLQIT